MKEYFSKPYVLYLALLSFGINLGFNFQLTYLSSVFKLFGAESQQLSFLWLAPAITGLLIQPILGYISDASTTFRHKRRPYMIGSGVLGGMAYCALPYATSLVTATLLIWVLNASVNGCIAMWRALTNDLSTEEEKSKNFAFQAFCAGIGAVTGVALPYLLNKLSESGRQTVLPDLKEVTIPLNLHWAFMISGITLLLVVFISAFKLKEPYKKEALSSSGHKQPRKFSTLKLSLNVFTDLAANLKKSSTEFKKFSLINSITAFGIFIFFIYFIMALAQNFYGLPVGLTEESSNLQAMSIIQKATSESSGYLSFSQAITVTYSLFLFFLLSRTDKAKLIHGISLLVGGSGLLLIGWAETQSILILSMINMGILMASFNVLPYMIISKTFPGDQAGAYFGLFNVSITLSQILAALILSPVYLTLFSGHGSYMMYLAGVLVLISALLWLREARTET